jgi:hypothetical protein
LNETEEKRKEKLRLKAEYEKNPRNNIIKNEIEE